jgi:DNA-binding MarR family transcriptional regulator/GNAT superfamily N-acetyltransferase
MAGGRMTSGADLEQQITAVRRFNRFYTRHVGALNEGLLNSPFSLAEVRVLYELANREKPTASELAGELALDASYLSRILRKFRERGLVASETAASDARRSLLSLTKQGRKVFAPLDRRSHDEVVAVLAGFSEADRQRLLEAMQTIETLLGGRGKEREPYVLRMHQPGDMGWVIHRHGVLYAREYGWDETFEALVADIAARFIREFEPKRERCWIAERDGRIVGSVFLVGEAEAVAKLRLLYVEPEARGLGIGRRLVAECIRFARQAGYRRITLWTNDVLVAARRIYEAAGFRLVAEERHRSFGRDLVGQNWQLDL